METILENKALLKLINTYGETEVSIVFNYIASVLFMKNIFEIRELIQLHFHLSYEIATNYIIAYGL